MGGSNQMHPDLHVVLRIGKDEAPTYNDDAFSKMRYAFGISDNFLAAENFDFGDLSEGGGKGGNLMAFSKDKLYIVKEMNGGDHNALLALTNSYVIHVLDGCGEPDQPCNSLLSRFYAHFYFPSLKKNFVVMNNWLYSPTVPIDRSVEGLQNPEKVREVFKKSESTFDLKGSDDDKAMRLNGEKVEPIHKRIWQVYLWFGKCFWSKKRRKYYEGKVHSRLHKFTVTSHQQEWICSRIRRDVAWMIDNNLMDYSLLVGEYHSEDPVLATELPRLTGTLDNKTQPLCCKRDTRYYANYVGIIDFLQTWGCGKVVANAIKVAERRKSTVPPREYGVRFLKEFEKKFVACGTEFEGSEHPGQKTLPEVGLGPAQFTPLDVEDI